MPKEWKSIPLIKAVEALAANSSQSAIEGKYLAIHTKIEKGQVIPKSLLLGVSKKFPMRG